MVPACRIFAGVVTDGAEITCDEPIEPITASAGIEQLAHGGRLFRRRASSLPRKLEPGARDAAGGVDLIHRDARADIDGA